MRLERRRPGQQSVSSVHGAAAATRRFFRRRRQPFRLDAFARPLSARPHSHPISAGVVNSFDGVRHLASGSSSPKLRTGRFSARRLLPRAPVAACYPLCGQFAGMEPASVTPTCPSTGRPLPSPFEHLRRSSSYPQNEPAVRQRTGSPLTLRIYHSPGGSQEPLLSAF